MYYSIFRKNILVTRVKPDSNSELSQKKQQEDLIRLNFTLDTFVLLEIGDYILFDKTGYFYRLNKEPRIVESPSAYKYECTFEGPMHDLKKVKVFLDTVKTDGGVYRDYKFSLAGNAETFLYFIVQNLQRAGIACSYGSFKDTVTTVIDFNNWNAFEAITEISETLSFSWYFENGILHFNSKEVTKSYVFQTGRKNGFTELVKVKNDSTDLVTVLYGYGNTENLPPRTASEGLTYDSNLLTENRLSFAGEDGESKLSKNTDIYGIIEGVQEFDIQPEFTGVVSGTSDTVRSFYDTSIPFDINEYLLSGIYPKITFLTGKLIGLTFNISFDFGTKLVTLDYYSDESGSYPNDLIFAEVGDMYKIYDIGFPEVYITEAQQRLKDAAQEYLDEHSRPAQTYKGTIDSEYIQNYGIVLNLGDVVRIISKKFNIDGFFEIKELTQGITDINKYTITFGDTLPLSLISVLKQNRFKTTQSIYSVQKTSITNNQITTNIGGSLEWKAL